MRHLTLLKKRLLAKTRAYNVQILPNAKHFAENNFLRFYFKFLKFSQSGKNGKNQWKLFKYCSKTKLLTNFFLHLINLVLHHVLFTSVLTVCNYILPPWSIWRVESHHSLAGGRTGLVRWDSLLSSMISEQWKISI